MTLESEASSRRAHLIVLVVESLGSLLGKAYHNRPVAVLEGRLELEVDPILKAGSLAIHEERDAEAFPITRSRSLLKLRAANGLRIV